MKQPNINYEFLKELEEMYTLKNIIRYNNIPRIKNESVAEHSFFVALIVERLSKYYIFDIGHALRLSIIHDIFEIWISDLPRNIKNKYRKLDKMMDEIEDDVIKTKYPEYQGMMLELNEMTSVEGMIVKLADNLSILQYAQTEVRLGNHIYMPQVVTEVIDYINTLLISLERYKK